MTDDNSNNNNNENESGMSDEEQASSEEFELLFSEQIGTRVFVTNSGQGFSFIGLVMDEIEDSFLVGIPCKISKTADGLELGLEEMLPTPYGRFLKSGLLMVAYPFDQLEASYQEYLSAIAIDHHQEFLNSFGYGLDEDEVEQTNEQNSAVINHLEGDIISVSNLTQEELSGKIEDAMAGGRLIKLTSTLPN